MKLTTNVNVEQDIPIRDMPDGSFGIITQLPEDMFLAACGSIQKGEVIFRNVAGWHGLTGNRFWASEYILRHQSGAREYIPAIGVRLLKTGDTLTVSE